MLDAAQIEDSGIPAIVLVHDIFEQAAKLQAGILGRPGLNLVIFPQGKPEMSVAEVDRLASEALDKVTSILNAS